MAQHAIFIGYRRDDTADVAGRIYDAMTRRFGRKRIFKDVDNLRPGADFGEYIKTVLPRCRVFLALIGPGWVDAKDEYGARRLDDPHDWVRTEIETALATPGLDVVPVLVNGARMPRAEELPEAMRGLLRRHAAIIRRDPDFHDDVGRLATALNASVRTGVIDLGAVGGDKRAAAAKPEGRPGGSRLLALGGVAAILIAAFFLLLNALTGPSVETVGEETAAVTEPPPVDPAAAPPSPANPAADPVVQKTATVREPEMVRIPGGTFSMGSPRGETGRGEDEDDSAGTGGAQVSVSVRAFEAGKYEVTFAEWDACVAGGGCGGYRPADEGWGQGSQPVINVSWNDAKAYVTWLSEQTGKRYRLLTEAEWEYAARGGSTGAYWWGASASRDYANYGADTCCSGLASGADRWVNTSPVGSFPANPFGLHDMHGNVWEWVSDCYANSYSGSAQKDCSLRVIRGGSWYINPPFLRSAYRDWITPSNRDYILGFRIARTL